MVNKTGRNGVDNGIGTLLSVLLEFHAHSMHGHSSSREGAHRGVAAVCPRGASPAASHCAPQRGFWLQDWVRLLVCLVVAVPVAVANSSILGRPNSRRSRTNTISHASASHHLSPSQRLSSARKSQRTQTTAKAPTRSKPCLPRKGTRYRGMWLSSSSTMTLSFTASTRIIHRSVVRSVMRDNDPNGFGLRHPRSRCFNPREELTSPGSHVSEESCQSNKTDATSAAQDTEPENHPQLIH